jgi:hypothetical protein
VAVVMAKQRTAARERIPREWGEPGGPFPVFALNDEQWNTVAKLSGISADNIEARQKFDDIIGTYRRFEVSDAVPSAKIGKKFKALRNDILVLSNRLLQLTKNPTVHFALTVAKQPEGEGPFRHSPKRLDAARRLESALAALNDLAGWLENLPDWLAAAASLVDRSKRGPNAANVYWLVAALDAIRERFTGLRISRSGKKNNTSRGYITEVCQIANPNIGSGTIDAAMKRAITRHGKDSD